MEIEQLEKKYENKVKEIEIKLKSKYFVPNTKIDLSSVESDSTSIKIIAYDDMFYDMYFKKKYFNDFDKKYLNIENKITGNIIKDLNLLFDYFDKLFLHDVKFKISKYEDKFNYFSPNFKNEIFLYNSLDKETYQQSEFRKQLWFIENIINKKILPYYKNYDININFFDDDNYNMVWIIFKIIKKN